MEELKGIFVLRKLSTTFVVTTMFSLLFVLIYAIPDGFGIAYNQGNQFMSWFFVYLMYIGVVVLVFGNLVSIIIEYLQTKWFHQHNWLYVFILGIFGLANGLLFQERSFALIGILVAILYGIIDKWLYKRMTKNKSIKMFLLLPIVLLGIGWCYFQFTSPPMPPFTKEDAVHSVTSGIDKVNNVFPLDIDKWEGIIGGYHVTRETSAREIGKGIYIVAFTESWEKGSEKGSFESSYKVERGGGLTSNAQQGEIPPYYNGD